MATLPTVTWGEFTISRLLIGHNPLKGQSHLDRELDAEMAEWYDPETGNDVAVLERCEAEGINTAQFGAPNMHSVLRRHKEAGGSMQWIATFYDTEGADPAWRFAVASVRVLDAGARDPLWGRAVLRLSEGPTPLHAEVRRHLRADLDEGHRTGRFTHGDDPVTVDLVSGTLMAALRRLVSRDAVAGTSRDPSAGDPGDGFVADVVARLLQAIGVDASEAAALATAAHDDERHRVDE